MGKATVGSPVEHDNRDILTPKERLRVILIALTAGVYVLFALSPFLWPGVVPGSFVIVGAAVIIGALILYDQFPKKCVFIDESTQDYTALPPIIQIKRNNC